MTKRSLRHCIPAVFVLALLSAALAFAHPGGLDAYGGHNDRKHGGYHFHRGALAGQSFGTKEEALAALGSQRGGTATSQRSGIAASRDERVDALTRLLIRKGIITEQELSEELRAELGR